MKEKIFVKIQKILKIFIITVVVSFFLIYIFNLFKNFLKLSSTESLLIEANSRLEIEENKKLSLQEKLNQISSDEYKKYQAKQSLGYVEDGEVVIILPDEETLKKLSPRKEITKKQTLPDPNWKKWVKVFFDI